MVDKQLKTQSAPSKCSVRSHEVRPHAPDALAHLWQQCSTCLVSDGCSL